MVDVIGFRITRNNSAAWSQRLRNRVALETEASAQRVLDAASKAAPVETGALSQDGEVEQIDALHYRVVFGRNLPRSYAIYQELGTSIMAAQPFLYPSFQNELPTLMARLAITTQGRVTVPLGAGNEGLEIIT